MKTTIHFAQHSEIKRLFLSYLLLGVTDTVHHLHAAKALGLSNVQHAVWVDLVLITAATLLVAGFLYSKNRIMLWGFITITVLATLIPGFYHGGWHHFIKILAFVRINEQPATLRSLFPADNFNLWFYEISGSLEFILALLTAFFLIQLMQKRNVRQ